MTNTWEWRANRWPCLALAASALLPGVLIPAIRASLWTLVVPTVLLITLIVTLLWPSAGLRGYFAYRTPVVVAAFIAELWIIGGGLTLQLPGDIHVSDWWFSAFLVSFFALTAINSLPGLTGEYRSGVGLRPDLIFGGGAYLVRGGDLRRARHRVPDHPPVGAPGLELVGGGRRGHGHADPGRLPRHPEDADAPCPAARRAGLARRWATPGLWWREIFLYLALFFVVYAFANMYLGRVPFTWTPGQGHGGPGWWGLAWLTAAFVVLVPIRGWLKTRLPEPATLIQELGKQAMMWIGLVLLVYGFVVLFDGRIRTIHYGGTSTSGGACGSPRWVSPCSSPCGRSPCAKSSAAPCES